MKKRRFILYFASALVVMFTASLVWAGVTNYDSVTVAPTSDDTYGLRLDNSSGTRKFSVDSSGNVYIAGTLTNATTKTINLPLAGFSVVDSGLTTMAMLTASSTPKMTMVSALPVIQWADGQTSPVMITFKVPADYLSGGTFPILASQTATGNYISYDVLINKTGATAFDSSGSTNAALIVSATQTTSPTAVTLNPSTDFASLVAGDWVSLRIWREDTINVSTGSVNLEGVPFSYTSSR